MFRGIRRLLNARSFTSSKDPQTLKDQFKKMTEIHSQASKDLKDSKETLDDLKMTDQEKATEDLKSKFDMFKSDLSKNTGEAKSVFEKLYETARTLKKDDLSIFNKNKNTESSSKGSSMEDEINELRAIARRKNLSSAETLKTSETSAETKKSSEPSPSTKKSEETVAEAENPEQKAESLKAEACSSETVQKKSFYQSFCQKFPRTSYYTDVCGKYVGDLWKETFPNPETKLEKLVKIHEMRKLSKELDEKLMKGEITENDLPAWKKSALIVPETKKSSWQKLREKLSTQSSRASVISESEAAKAASSKIKDLKSKINDLKTEVNEMKEAVNEVIEESESGLVHSAKKLVRDNLTDTVEGRTLKIMRQHDPDFDLYSMEGELPILVEDLFNHALAGDAEYVKNITTGQAREYLGIHIRNAQENEIGKVKSSISSITRTSYLGCNLEDKNEPKVSYSMRISWVVLVKYNFGLEEEAKGITAKSSKMNIGNFFITISPHPDPDVIRYRHPWKFVIFFPSDDANRVGTSR